ncbi:NAD(P)-binding domain-containing protein [Virgisporangium ochraceum]|uniref:Monooxygenase n=1 Tax=Virgisporangium ochraceum TaxID=65505 RepID=A0A8J4EE05_9ACTN|nr:NAD(P)-binding domain-containing protein [Virgisporangium ochraceum]GIJ71113.1 monooxygenase [Virgisporangium ochraceum]
MGNARYCIVGAGAAGLAAVKVLRDHGLDVDCFERTDRVGGHWHTDYESLHLITSRDVSGFAGFPMPADYPVYPSRDQMRDYLESFAKHFGLYEHITFETSVESMTPREGGWTVRTDDGQVRGYDAVLVANGHLTDPYVPAVAAHFTGRSLHSHDYMNVGDVEGDRVLVVGVGNSGCDLVVDAANARLEAHISIRRGQVFQPKAIFGRPRAELTWMAKLHPVLQERLTRALVRIVVGPVEVYRGLPVPATRNLNRQKPVVNNLLLYWIHHGRITPRPGIESITGKTVLFADGTSTEFDTIIWATGFRTSVPFLDPSVLRYERHQPLRVGGLTVPVGTERLYFIGMAAPRGPQLPVYSAQAELVVRFLRLHERRPSFPLSAHLAATQRPDTRIDIVRHEWQKQMDRTHRAVRRLSPHERSAMSGRA